MGRSANERQGGQSAPVVAFDFDGTLTFQDSFMAFLAWRAGPLGYAFGLLALIPEGLVYAVRRDRGRLKAAAARIFLGRLSREALAASCRDFADSPLGRRLIRPDAEQCWAEWRAKGAHLVIVTASPEDLVAPFAERLGADALIGTRLRYDAAGRLEGRLEGLNCRGPEKVVRLRAAYGPDIRLAAAYGDSGGDLQMLQIADIQGYRVFHAVRPRPAPV